MEQMIVVDDEIRQCRGLRNLLEKAYPQWGITAFTDAQEALAYLGTNPVRIVITDIRMPDMDGLELTRRVKETDSTMIIILLTGFAEFEYARQAVTLGAFDYLLKPLNPEKLKEVLSRAFRELEQRNLLYEEQRRIQERLDVTLPVYMEQQLNQWVYGILSEEDSRELEKIFPDGRRGLVVAASLPGWEEYCRRVNKTELEEKQLNIKWWMRRALERFGHTISFFSRTLSDTMITIVSFDAGAPNSQERQIQNHITGAVHQFEQDFGLPVTVGVGEESPDLVRHIERCYKSAAAVLAYRFYFQGGTVLAASYILPKRTQFLENSLVEEDGLRDAVRQGDYDRAEQLLQSVLDRRLDSGYPEPERLKASMLGCVSHVACFFQDLFEPEEWTAFLSQMEAEVLSQTECAAFFQVLCSWLTRLAGQVSQRKNGKASGLADRLRDYLEEHYGEDISLTQISAHFHLAPSYFSGLIKELTGSSFSKNLIEVRMKRAKELLHSSEHRIYEIAEQTGFNDVKYFIRVFKKETGMAPAQYREQFSQLETDE